MIGNTSTFLLDKQIERFEARHKMSNKTVMFYLRM